jgi:hypothetical protein
VQNDSTPSDDDSQAFESISSDTGTTHTYDAGGNRVYPDTEPRQTPLAIIQIANNPVRIIVKPAGIYLDVTNATQNEVKAVWPIVAKHQDALKQAGLSAKRKGPEGVRDEGARRWIDRCQYLAQLGGRDFPSSDDVKQARQEFKQECEATELKYSEEYSAFWYPYVQRRLNQRKSS